MRNVVFLVKNGIGFGHIRRAVLLAEAVQRASEVQPVIISQASSLALYADTPVKVINFPLLHRVTSAVAEDRYESILERLLDRLDPAVIVEDTYPDPRYLKLTALADRPRLLVMRRLDGLSFDQLRTRGRFAAYDKILIAQDPEGFAHEGHSGESLTAVRHSGVFSFVGNLSHIPTAQEISAARQAYAPLGEPLVAVNGGAGGDQMPDGYGDRLFNACATLAAKLHAEDHPARFVFVTGPYYAGRPLADAPNVTVRQFEPQLAALLAAADVAVIKPGNNALSEALSGQGNLVLVPDASFMEGLDKHARRVARRYGGAVANNDPHALETAVRAALKLPPRTVRPEPNTNGIDAVVAAIHRHASPRPVAICRRILLLLSPGAQLHPERVREILPQALSNAVVIDDTCPGGDVATLAGWRSRAGSRRPKAVVLDGAPPSETPQALADQGASLLITSGPASPAIERWLRLAPASPALTIVASSMVRAKPGRTDLLTRRLAALLDAADPACLFLDLSRLTGATEVHDYLRHLASWLAEQPILLVSPQETTAMRSRRLLESA
ncbi:MAG: hypothetical protein ACRDT4_05645 [Micromonosporaceae bacterium]